MKEPYTYKNDSYRETSKDQSGKPPRNPKQKGSKEESQGASRMGYPAGKKMGY